MGTIIGIDFGTSTTEAAVFRDGKPVMILNFDGKEVTPSVVGSDESGNLIVGDKAKAQTIMAPDRTVMEVKRKMGTEERLHIGKQSYTPVELSSMIMSYVRRYASEFLAEEITRAVISVPAYFDDIQRQATVEAGRKAGFTVERIINEPTAAALCYGLDHMEEESHILVYDLGGGTFDVTLLEMFDGVLEVKASSGDNQLGGKDFDQSLIDWMAGRFQERYGVDLTKDVYASARLKAEAERCKIQLSTNESVSIRIPMIASKDGAPLALEEEVTREIFNGLIEPLIKRTHYPIDVVLGDSGISREEIDLVLLVGGSTRVPLVACDIEKYLNLKPATLVNPDFAVAEGAAIQAAIIAGGISEEDSIIMTDVNPYTLGIRAMTYDSEDFMSVIIPRNVTIPVTKTETYYTSWDGQERAEIEVFQGEHRTASKNHLLGKFMVEGIPWGPRGEQSIGVSFSYNQNGMLEVTAVIDSTGKTAEVTIDMMGTEKEAKIDVSGWREAPDADDYRTVIRRGERFLKKEKGNLLDEEGAEELEHLLYLIKKFILEGDLEEADDLEEEIGILIDEYSE